MRLRVGVIAIAAAALAVLVSQPQPAGAAEGGSTVADRAVVEVATEPVPAGAATGSRRWRQVRAQAGDVLSRVADRNGLEVSSRIPETGQLAVTLAGETVAELRSRLSGDPRVTAVRADRAIQPRLVPNDPGYGTQWFWPRLNAPAAWDITRGAGAEVAVLDIGFEVGHPDLAGRIAGALDCVGGCSGTGVGSSNGHGTHVAGLACATAGNGYGVASAGFGCSLFPIRIDLCSEAAQAVVFAGNRGSDAINMSFGGCDASMNNELQYALGRGSVLVAAGDNSPNPNPSTNYPAQWIQPLGTGPQAGFNRGLVVTAAMQSGAKTSWAQGDTAISVAAFGGTTNAIGGAQGILSTWISSGFCSCRATIAGDSRFAYLQGTSMAAPQVAGIVALMRSVNQSLAAPDAVALVKETASQCGAYGNGLGWGIVDAHRAVLAAFQRDIDPPVSKAKRGRGKIRVKRSDEASDRRCIDDAPASGVEKVLLFVSVNGGDYRKFGRVKGKSERFRPKAGKRYRFYSIAIDKAGNREAPPLKADTKVRKRR